MSKLPAVQLTDHHLHVAFAVGARGLAPDLNGFQVVPIVQQLAQLGAQINALGLRFFREGAHAELESEEAALNAHAVSLCEQIGCVFQPLGAGRPTVGIMVPSEGGPDFWML